MVEGQNGLSWERWRHILALAERLGFPTVFRSDHYFFSPTRQQDSLEAYLSFVAAALETSSLRFGPLVTPITFREPVNVARMAAQIDVLSGGRFVMGLGAGWNAAEHQAYGIPFPPIRERFDRLEDAIKLMQALWRENPATYKGSFYSIEDVDCLPRPAKGRPPILIGGVGEKRTLPLTARYADEWNSTPLPIDEYAGRAASLERHCEDLGRNPASIRRSMMILGIVGRTPAQVERAGRHTMSIFAPDQEFTFEEIVSLAKRRGMLVGTTDEVVDQLASLAQLGLQDAVFEHFDFDSDELPEYLAAEIVPRVRNL